MDVLAWLDAVAGLSLLAVGLVGWRHYRTSAAFAAAAAVAWFVVPVAPALVLLHRPLLFHSVLALPGRPVAGLLPRLLLLTAWIGLLLPAAAQPWVALATAALAVAVALKAAVVARPALLALAVGLALPVVERAVWPQYVDAGLAVATYLCAVTACSAAMLLEMLGSGLRHADSVIELSDRTPDQALAALRPLATAEASTRPGGPLASALTLLEDNMRLQQDLAERIDEVRASRARLIEATSDERQRLERMLSDGVMRYLDGLEENLDSMADHEHADPMLAACREEVARLREDLEQMARGLHPRVLSDRGLAVAIEQLCQRSPVPVQVHAPAGRFPERTETTVWYAVAEALANVWKHANATHVVVHLEASPSALKASVHDDGIGGATLSSGGGLAGLVDRLSDVEGRLSLASTPAGTAVTIEVPRT